MKIYFRKTHPKEGKKKLPFFSFILAHRGPINTSTASSNNRHIAERPDNKSTNLYPLLPSAGENATYGKIEDTNSNKRSNAPRLINFIEEDDQKMGGTDNNKVLEKGRGIFRVLWCDRPRTQWSRVKDSFK